MKEKLVTWRDVAKRMMWGQVSREEIKEHAQAIADDENWFARAHAWLDRHKLQSNYEYGKPYWEGHVDFEGHRVFTCPSVMGWARFETANRKQKREFSKDSKIIWTYSFPNIWWANMRKEAQEKFIEGKIDMAERDRLFEEANDMWEGMIAFLE